MMVIVIGCESGMHDASPHSPLALTSPKGMAVGATGADGVADGVDLWICSNSYGLGPKAVYYSEKYKSSSSSISSLGGAAAAALPPSFLFFCRFPLYPILPPIIY